MTDRFDPASVRFDEATGLVPAIVRDAADGDVLMLGYMNEASLARTLETGRVTFFSRSRQTLWEKGETSGNTLSLVSIAADCDSDALLVTAEPAGPTCHTGTRSCFESESLGDSVVAATTDLGSVIDRLSEVIAQRDRTRPEASYTTDLLEAGPLRCGQKVAEEGVETALAAVAEPDRVVSESADLLYHLLVLWRSVGVTPDDVAAELAGRAR